MAHGHTQSLSSSLGVKALFMMSPLFRMLFLMTFAPLYSLSERSLNQSLHQGTPTLVLIIPLAFFVVLDSSTVPGY